MALVKWAVASLLIVAVGMFIINRVQFLRNIVMGAA